MNAKTNLSKGQPEVLAGLAAAAQAGGKKPAAEGLQASGKTIPGPVDQNEQVDAATKVLREGATGKKQGADKAIHELPDRIKPKSK